MSALLRTPPPLDSLDRPVPCRPVSSLLFVELLPATENFGHVIWLGLSIRPRVLELPYGGRLGRNGDGGLHVAAAP